MEQATIEWIDLNGFLIETGESLSRDKFQNLQHDSIQLKIDWPNNLSKANLEINLKKTDFSQKNIQPIPTMAKQTGAVINDFRPKHPNPQTIDLLVNEDRKSQRFTLLCLTGNDFKF